MKSCSDNQRKAMFAKMNKGTFSHLKGVIPKASSNSFAVSSQTMAMFYDPMAIQPQTSLLMMHPELGLGPMNLESKRPKGEK